MCGWVVVRILSLLATPDVHPYARKLTLIWMQPKTQSGRQGRHCVAETKYRLWLCMGRLPWSNNICLFVCLFVALFFHKSIQISLKLFLYQFKPICKTGSAQPECCGFYGNDVLPRHCTRVEMSPSYTKSHDRCCFLHPILLKKSENVIFFWNYWQT